MLLCCGNVNAAYLLLALEVIITIVTNILQSHFWILHHNWFQLDFVNQKYPKLLELIS